MMEIKDMFKKLIGDIRREKEKTKLSIKGVKIKHPRDSIKDKFDVDRWTMGIHNRVQCAERHNNDFAIGVGMGYVSGNFKR